MLIAGIYKFDNWRNDFMNYLLSKGYSPSVSKDYPMRIGKIINDEGITVQELSVTIDKWIAEYKTGKYVGINKAKHYAPSSALMKFKDFYPTLYKTYTANPANEDVLESLGQGPCKIIF